MNHSPVPSLRPPAPRAWRGALAALAGALAGALLLAATGASLAADAVAPRDAELRASVVTLRAPGDDAARNAALTYLENLSRRFPADPYVAVQLANAYGVQAHFAKTRDAKAVWAAKAEAVLNEVIAAHPRYLLAQATRGLQLVMAPPVLGLEAQGEQQLKRVIASQPAPHSDDDEAIVTAHVFLARLYERQARSLSGEAQAARTRAAEQVRADLKQRYPGLDLARLAS